MLDQSGKDALRRFLAGGGPYCGVHSAAACLRPPTFTVDTLGGEQIELTSLLVFAFWAPLMRYPLAAFDFHPELQQLVCDPWRDHR